MDFENSKIKGIHISRYIASWANTGFPINSLFGDWLETLEIDGERLTEDEIDRIWNFAKCGKCEFQLSAKVYQRSKGF